MEIEDIMYDDWLEFPHGYDKAMGVHVKDYEVVVDWLLDQGIVSEKIENVNPIPLSKEIIFKMGLFVDGDNYRYTSLGIQNYDRKHYFTIEIIDYGLDGYGLYVGHVDGENSYTYENKHIEYVHEVQHALHDCKVKFEFEL
jgi:hypothetical protein